LKENCIYLSIRKNGFLDQKVIWKNNRLISKERHLIKQPTPTATVYTSQISSVFVIFHLASIVLAPATVFDLTTFDFAQGPKLFFFIFYYFFQTFKYNFKLLWLMIGLILILKIRKFRYLFILNQYTIIILCNIKTENKIQK
jgi:hypothetical protein